MNGHSEEDNNAGGSCSRDEDVVYGPPTQALVEGLHTGNSSFDVTLNIIDVVSSIDEQSKTDFDSLAASSSFPELHYGSGNDNDNDNNRRLYPYYPSPDDNKASRSTRNQQRYQRRRTSTRDEESQQQTKRSRDISSSKINNAAATSSSTSRSRVALIIRHFRLVVLSAIFFILGSALFLWASVETYQQEINKSSSSQQPTSTAEPVVAEDPPSQSPAPAPSPSPEGYHLQISTSIDTWITQQMLLMLCATFCFLQVGIINFVRTPLDRFHFFQILAGVFGLVSAMFWETNDIFSTIAYFFFVHAMAGQSLMQFHAHYWTMVAPNIKKDDNKNDEKDDSKKVFTTPRPRRHQQEGHFAFQDLSLDQSPSGLLEEGEEDAAERRNSYDDHYRLGTDDSSGDGNENTSFSNENGFSVEDHQDPSPTGADYRGITTSAVDEEQIMIQQGLQMTSPRNRERDDDDATCKYGIAFCAADGIFILGSAVELVLAYWMILRLTNDENEDIPEEEDETHWDGIVSGLHLLPGILWLVFAIMTLVATVLLHRHSLRMAAT